MLAGVSRAGGCAARAVQLTRTIGYRIVRVVLFAPGPSMLATIESLPDLAYTIARGKS
jgi:hypothetical protein